MILSYGDFLNEANEVFDIRASKKSTIFYARLIKNALMIFDKDSRVYGSSIENTKYVSLPVDIQVEIDTTKKTINLKGDWESYDDFSKGYSQEREQFIRQAGNPKLLNKIVQELKKRRFIDSSYSVINNDEKFQVDDTSRVTVPENSNSIVLYHGTLESNINSILKKGLRPQDTEELGDKSYFRGNTSTIKNYTDKNVYLTPSLDIAKAYALKQAKSNENHQGRPAVLKVIVPNPALLMVDDDVLFTGIMTNVNSTCSNFKTLDHASQKEISETEAYYQTLDSTNSTVYDARKSLKDEEYALFCKTPWSNHYVYSWFGTGSLQLNNVMIPNNMFDIVFNNSIGNMNPTIAHTPKKSVEDMHKFYQKEIPGYYQWLIKEVKKEYGNFMNQQWDISAYGEISAIAYHGIIMPKFITVMDAKFKTRDVEY